VFLWLIAAVVATIRIGYFGYISCYWVNSSSYCNNIAKFEYCALGLIYSASLGITVTSLSIFVIEAIF
jgi:hypothetical protein